jgi:hypothetical protein
LLVQGAAVEVGQRGNGLENLLIELDAFARDQLQRPPYAALRERERQLKIFGVCLDPVSVERRAHCLLQRLTVQARHA